MRPLGADTTTVEQTPDPPPTEGHRDGVAKLVCAAPMLRRAAAPTTSLPEGIGSGRTWDYRFTWVRDASITLQGPFIGGERDLTEHTIPRLSGWRDSGPARTGNQAWGQRQLDIYGALLDAAYTLRDQLEGMALGTRVFLMAAVEAAVARWRDDDQGRWGMRGQPRPYLHSKLMGRVALERGIAMADHLDAGEHVARWAVERDELREAILREGWNESVGAYTQYVGPRALATVHRHRLRAQRGGLRGPLHPRPTQNWTTLPRRRRIETALKAEVLVAQQSYVDHQVHKHKYAR